MARITPLGVKLNGKDLKVPAHYLIEGGTEGTYVHARLLVEALGVGTVSGKGSHIEIVTEKQTPVPKPLEGRRIAVSAGHYGQRNQSPCNSQYYESEFVLKVALELEQMLLADGAIVHLPRRTSAVLTLAERTNRINQFGADITIDLHTDAAGSGCNTVARGVHAIHQLSRTGDNLATLLVDEVAKSLGLPARSRKIWTREGQRGFDWYHMLRVPHGHNVVIEAGFHTSRDDIKILTQPDALRKYAEGVRTALRKYYS